jgi:hypothetical protein
MACDELVRLRAISEGAREQLRQPAPELVVSPANELAWSTWERSLRTVIFSADIDADFHAARCPHCGPAGSRGITVDAEPQAA